MCHEENQNPLINRANTNQMEIQEKSITINDQDAIELALEESYFKGIYEGNIGLLRQLYHAGTLMFGDVKGQPYYKSLDQYLEGVRSRTSPRDSDTPFKGEIISIRILNSIAIAEVKVRIYAFHYHEYLSFHKMNGNWLIVNKMISDTSE
jgi:hypothetical protein